MKKAAAWLGALVTLAFLCAWVGCSAVLGLESVEYSSGSAGSGGGGLGGPTQSGGNGGMGTHSSGVGVVGAGGCGTNCGPNNDDDCCAIGDVEGGVYNRSNVISSPAAVNAFQLDKYEVTVGRFRNFVAQYPKSKPSAGAGAHAAIKDSGWQSSWDALLPMTQESLVDLLPCESDPTWTNSPLDNEHKPINCVSWYEAFAFCAWDGGRLPTEAEWNYAAAGGSEQRTYPWGGMTIDTTFANYSCNGDGNPGCAAGDILPVGSRSPKGDGKWGHVDMSGNLWEWALDWATSYINPCDNCANLNPPVPPLDKKRRRRGGGYSSSDESTLTSLSRSSEFPENRSQKLGFRCARNL